MTRLSLTARDRDLLVALTTAVRTFSTSQVAGTWWASTSGAAVQRRLTTLAAADYVVLARQAVAPLLPLTDPTATWQPGGVAPDLRRIAARARLRWRAVPRTILCVTATARSAEMLGGRGGRPPRPREWTHDLHVAQVYLHLRAAAPDRARTFRHEDLEDHALLERAGAKLPDAVVEDVDGPTAIELVGASYTEAKLQAFHAYCASLGLRYELW